MNSCPSRCLCRVLLQRHHFLCLSAQKKCKGHPKVKQGISQWFSGKICWSSCSSDGRNLAILTHRPQRCRNSASISAFCPLFLNTHPRVPMCECAHWFFNCSQICKKPVVFSIHVLLMYSALQNYWIHILPASIFYCELTVYSKFINDFVS